MDQNTIEKFAKFCDEKLDLTKEHYQPDYKSLTICILDCVYSLRAKYESTTNVVKKYAETFSGRNQFECTDTLSDFIKNVQCNENCLQFSQNVLKNRQKLANRNKAEICLELAIKFRDWLNIETIDDFNDRNKELLELVILSTKGIGKAGADYLFMLTGDQNRCKQDVHINNYINKVLGLKTSLNNEECQLLFINTVEYLNSKHSDIFLTPKHLDSIIWQLAHEDK